MITSRGDFCYPGSPKYGIYDMQGFMAFTGSNIAIQALEVKNMVRHINQSNSI